MQTKESQAEFDQLYKLADEIELDAETVAAVCELADKMGTPRDIALKFARMGAARDQLVDEDRATVRAAIMARFILASTSLTVLTKLNALTAGGAELYC